MVAYMRTLKTVDERVHFERHLKRYINIWLPECPFEVCTTNRYTITTAEACVIARKPIKAGDTVKYLSGIQVEMSEEEEKALSSRTDFSIVLSSRRKRPSLFLGPARFANHDCDSNAKLTTTGPHGISIVACKNIAIGEEITVTYGWDYFGEDNCECLCATCERLTRNGWDPRGPILHEETSDEESEVEDARPAKRQRTTGVFDSRSRSDEPQSATNPLKRKRQGTQEGDVQMTDNAPFKRGRGRPRKNVKSAEISGADQTHYRLDFQSMWIKQRALQSNIDAPVDIGLIKHAMLSKDADNDEYDDMHDDGSGSDHFSKRQNQAWKLMIKRNETQLKHQQAKLATSLANIARQLKISVDDVKKRFPPPGHPNHIPLSDVPQDISAAVRDDHHEALSSMKLQSDDELARELTPESMRVDATTDKTPHSTRRARLGITPRQHAASPLRKVTSINDNDEQAHKREGSQPQPSIDGHDQALPTLNRGRSRRSESLAYADTTQQVTTDESSPSSVFSNEGNADHVSPTSSVDDQGHFAPGRISQVIVDLYTSAGPDNDDQYGENRTCDEVAVAAASAHNIRRHNAAANVQVIAQGRSRTRFDGTSGTADQASAGAEVQGDEGDVDEEDEEERRGTPRSSGDYHLTEALLIDLHDRWVECRNCDQHFVQHDAYLTRMACPRCERHSKLYGFYWPKTDKINKDDREERVLDHRLIHRFIEPDEERNERKGRRTLLEMRKERDISSSRDADSTRSGSREDSRRRSRRFA